MIFEYAKLNLNLHDLVIEMFHGGEKEAEDLEKAEKEQEAIYSRLFTDIMSGRVNAAYTFTSGDETNGRQQIFHKSVKRDGCLQVSYIWYRNGEMIPVMDSQVKTAAELIRESNLDNVIIYAYKAERISHE